MEFANPERPALARPTCIGCGYDLRAQSPEGKCPECGLDVERSLHGYWLRYSDQQWVGTMLRGLDWIWTSMGILVGVVVLVVVWGIAIFFVIDPDASHPVLAPIMIVSLIAEGLGLVVSGVGIVGGLWMFSASEPRREGSEPQRTLALRVLTIALIPAFGSILLEMWGFASVAAGVPWWEAALLLAIPLVIGVQAMLLLNHAQSIERRCPGFDEVREKRLRTYRRTIMGFAIVATLLAIPPYLAVGRMFGPGSILALPWLAAIGQLGETRKRMRAELAISSAEEKIEAGRAT